MLKIIHDNKGSCLHRWHKIKQRLNYKYEDFGIVIYLIYDIVVQCVSGTLQC